MGKKFKGIVTSIANTANAKPTPDAVTEFEVKILILNTSYKDLQDEGQKYPFRPGMTASVDIITEIKEDVISVPLSSVTTRKPGESKKIEDDSEDSEETNRPTRRSDEKDDVEVVFVNDNGIAKKVEVKTGISDYDNIEILEGLEIDQEIVSGPFLVVSKRLEGDENIKAIENEDKKKGDSKEATD
jgi:HlyD family secretion protein